jgi:hypothetical protein
VNLETRRHLHTAYLVRTVEEQLLRLFAAGKLSGTTHTCIGQEMAAVALRLAAQDPRHDAGVGTRLVPLRDDIIGDVRAPLIILLAAVGFVMLIACANVASLMLGRTAAREYMMRAGT